MQLNTQILTQVKKDLEKIISDSSAEEEMKEMAKNELQDLEKKHKENEIKVENIFVAKRRS